MAKTVRVITDSTCDLPSELIRAEGIGVIAYPVIFGDRIYRDMVDIDRERFYELLTSSPELPHTSQPTPGEYFQAIRESLREADELILLPLSSGLSGAYENAVSAVDMLERGERARVSLLNTKAASVGQGLMALEAARMARSGEPRAAIVKRLEYFIDHLASVFTLDTLAYLEKGGRIGKVQAMMGTVLNVKPILQLDEAGRIVQREKVRGRKQSVQRILELMGEEGKNLELQTVGICHARAAAEAEAAAGEIRRRFLVKEVIVGEMSATIGTHVGPGCLAFFYLR